jgi:ribosome-binding protein aMBF1 (putative translation factor)
MWSSWAMDSKSVGLSNADPSILRGLELIGQVVYEGRRRAGVTQRRLAELADVDQSTISRLERGRLNGLRLKRLASILATLEWLAPSTKR